jgi:hypothetical protein
MDLAETVQYVFKRLKDVRPVTVQVAGQDYAVAVDGTLGSPVRDLAPQWDKPTFQVATLSALASLYAAKVDEFPDTVAFHVADYLNVNLVDTKADKYGSRHVYAHAQYRPETMFVFNKYMAAEDFLIAFKTAFYFNDNAVLVQKIVSTLESGQTISMADDGLSQQLEVKVGTVSKSQVKLPADGIPLIPWRTFRDADPVESKFLLRLQQVKDDLPKVALFDIDQKWQLNTVNSIAKWLGEKLPDARVIA